MRSTAVILALGMTVLAACRDDPSTVAVDPDSGPSVTVCAFLGIELDVGVPEDAGGAERSGDAVDIVFLEPDVSEEQRVAVEDALSVFAAVTYVDQQATFDEFVDRFADEPELVASVTPELLPPSFRIERADDEPQLAETSVADLPGVREVLASGDIDVDADGEVDEPSAAPGARPDSAGHALVALWYPVRHDVAVYFDPSAGPADFAPVVAALEELGAGVTLMSQEDAFAEFQRIFADSPELLATVTPDILPASARVDVTSRVGAGRIAVQPAVRDVRFTYDLPRVDALVSALVAAPGIDDTRRRVDDPLAADLAVLFESARQWESADPAVRTRGSVFDAQERARAAEAAGRVAVASSATCGVDLASAQRPEGL